MANLNPHQSIFQHLERGQLVITPNNRLSLQLLKTFSDTHASKTTIKPLCYSYQSWIKTLWQQLEHNAAHHQHPVILSPLQEARIWQNIIRRHESLLCNDGLIQEIQSAWLRLNQWRISIEDEAFLGTSQTAQFQQWCLAFKKALKQKNLMSSAQVISYLIDRIDTLDSPPTLWACFDDFTPEQRALQEALQSQNVPQQTVDLPVTQNLPAQYCANDTQDEFEQLSLWLEKQLANGRKNIAVVVPELQKQHQLFKRQLNRRIGDDAFNISLGKPLSDYPIAAHAFLLMSLNGEQYSQLEVKQLLHSPYLGDAKSEFLARADLQYSAAMTQHKEINHNQLLNTLKNKSPKLYQRLNGMNHYPSHARADVWVDCFIERLTVLGFPGDHGMNSATFQCFERLVATIHAFRQLSLTEEEISCKDALEILHQSLKTTVFQPRIDEKKIQVLGLLEASGCAFDSMWVCGMTDQCLPQKTRLSAFIPVDIQKNHNMPRANPEREMLLATTSFNRFKHCAAEIIFSYPAITGDLPNLPSPLLKGLNNHTPLRLKNRSTQSKLESYTETYSNPLAPNELLKGGTTLLANQAKCPFRAFAQHRLHLRVPNESSVGLNNAERGQLSHLVMELIWKEIKTSAVLHTLSNTQMNLIIEQAVKAALDSLNEQSHELLPPIVKALENDRLTKIAKDSLSFDKARMPFEVIATEKAYEFNLEGIPIQVRVDRIDQEETGEQWVIDYKSTLPASKPWNEERPEAPQLLLYALLDPNILTLLFLQLKSGQITASGLSEEKQSITGIRQIKKDETWTDKRTAWQKQLETLANELKEGHIPPTPQKQSTCQYCEYNDLCRRNHHEQLT